MTTTAAPKQVSQVPSAEELVTPPNAQVRHAPSPGSLRLESLRSFPALPISRCDAAFNASQGQAAHSVVHPWWPKLIAKLQQFTAATDFGELAFAKPLLSSERFERLVQELDNYYCVPDKGRQESK